MHPLLAQAGLIHIVFLEGIWQGGGGGKGDKKRRVEGERGERVSSIGRVEVGNLVHYLFLLPHRPMLKTAPPSPPHKEAKGYEERGKKTRVFNPS